MTVHKKDRKNRRPILLRKSDKMSKEERLVYFRFLASGEHIYNKDYDKCRKKKNKLTSDKCYICGSEAYCMHHIIPLSKNGKNRKRNLIPICLECHRFIHPFME